MHKNMQKNNGFTLLEMIIVITIVTILFLLTIPNIQTTLGIVDRKGDKARLKVVDSAIVQYRLEYNQDPTSTSELIENDLINEEQLQCSNNRIITIENGQAVLQ